MPSWFLSGSVLESELSLWGRNPETSPELGVRSRFCRNRVGLEGWVQAQTCLLAGGCRNPPISAGSQSCFFLFFNSHSRICFY